MDESREERLARIRGFVDAYAASEHASVAIESEIDNSGVQHDLMVDDVEWLLSQVFVEREYRVDWLCDGTADAWQTIEQPGSLEDALSSLSDLKRTSVESAFRVVSAPVQVWTVEEGTP